MIKFAFLSLVLAFAGLTAASAFNNTVDTTVNKGGKRKGKAAKPASSVHEQEDEAKEEFPDDEGEE
jgi:hypothetical protein